MFRVLSCWLLLLPCLAQAQSSDAPSYVLKLPASVKTVLIAETGTATLYRYQNGENGLLPGDEQRMSVGQNGVGKRKTGDRRTPLGIYFVVEELDTTNLHEKYGPVAFPLDYPNAWDQANARTGYGIWIHGVTPNSGPRPEQDTDGCIALANEKLLALEDYLTPLQTPVIVTRSIQRASAADITLTRDHLLAALQLWANSYRDGDWHRFLSLYAEDFAYRGMTLPEWSAFRLKTVATRPIDNFTIDDIMLLADPEEQGLYLSRFRQQISATGRTIVTTKRLYWRATSAGEFRIVAEDNG